MARPALPIRVTTKDRAELRELLKGGVQQVRVVLQGWTPGFKPRGKFWLFHVKR